VVARPQAPRRKGTRWISQFAALASMAGLVAVAAFLPAPGNRTSGNHSSSNFLGERNGEGLAREEWRLALEQREGVRDFEMLQEDALSLSPDGRHFAPASSLSTGRQSQRYAETEITNLMDGTSNVTLHNEIKVHDESQPGSAKSDSNRGRMAGHMP